MTTVVPNLPGAACVDVEPELFFTPDHERGTRAARRETQAKAVCARCPVIAECLEFALANPVMGVWGGTTEAQRRALARLDGRTYRTFGAMPGAGPLHDSCGTDGGYKRHLRRDEPACQNCRQAHARVKQDRAAS